MLVQGTSTVPQLRPFRSVDISAKKPVNNSRCPFLGRFNNTRFSPSLATKPRNLPNSFCCRCTTDDKEFSGSEKCGEASSVSEWDWKRWSRHFSDIEQAESFASVLTFQLEDAIEKEDFEEAAKLKMAIAQATSKDSVAEIMSQLKNAIDEERYRDASILSKSTGSGLVGWWVGCTKGGDDPFGKLVRITPGVGRFVATSYSPKQLLNSSHGTPLFEIFLVKDEDDRYIMQVVCLQRAKGKSKTSTNSPPKSTKIPSASEVENASALDVEENISKAETRDEKSVNIEGVSEEGIRGVINFFKDKMPGFKVKVMNLNVTEEDIEDADSLKQLMQEDEEEPESPANSAEEADKIQEILSDGVALGANNDSLEDEQELDTKLFISGVVHNNEDVPAKDEFVRLPAKIRDGERGSFILHIPEESLEYGREEREASNVRVGAIATKGISEHVPPDVAKAFFGTEKASRKLSRNLREILKLAEHQAKKQNNLSEYTNFSRITTSSNDLDPFEGLYVGVFGPYGMEVVQLRRKYGLWNGEDENASDVEFFEYVEAVKLTGDLNVPAGQVTFRAKIGKGSRNANRGMYPDELGVVASYKGQGRIAEFGFKNPKWVDGELLQLNGKGIPSYINGADLGFLYVVPGESFLVLFNRLKLPD